MWGGGETPTLGGVVEPEAIDFNTLVAAVSAADLAETLGAEGPYTVFAPTNEAFEALPAGLLDELLKPKNKEVLTQILTYHVVAGEVMSTDIEPGDVPTVEGEDLTIAVTDGTVTVNGATVEAASWRGSSADDRGLVAAR